ncbi:MAG: hypothetical protein BAJATHORv1_140006 [Candidatus Thorarchaeota archaeon]|nr:MAG: hypothetical protein BAJATHORv1_140006 [Candidatus Thorarchaeota archaeon]
MVLSNVSTINPSRGWGSRASYRLPEARSMPEMILYDADLSKGRPDLCLPVKAQEHRFKN